MSLSTAYMVKYKGEKHIVGNVFLTTFRALIHNRGACVIYMVNRRYECRLFPEIDLHLITNGHYIVQQHVASESRGVERQCLLCCDQVFRILSYSGRAHFTIHSNSRTCLAVGRDSGLYESIDRSIERMASRPADSIGGIPSACRGCCTLSSNLSSHDR